MSEVDKIKEEIGWLKITFGLSVITDISFIGWAAQNFFDIPVLLLSVAIIMVVLITWGIIVINRHVYIKLDKLGDL